ncbi:hypothetical protein [Myxococcus sp. RHSTA-1-4]|uniref:hypothetical protein n=1 Tax=Myxococcus sp. RHSTA-1-4 TaxID=2874601 RepID=UPI001CBF3971|nr:hypothetical protein [Myxococcus sp. RHSTA-1-4]MBZ4417586.1 hypothetical protein [Myxococcus sp. RHSTA-1-4]
MPLLNQDVRKPEKKTKEEPAAGSSKRRYTSVTEHSAPSKLDHDIKRSAAQVDKHASSKPLSTRGRAVAVIVKVRKADYVPPQVKVRSKMSPLIFTAELLEQSLSELSSDPNIVSVSTPKLLRNVD